MYSFVVNCQISRVGTSLAAYPTSEKVNFHTRWRACGSWVAPLKIRIWYTSRGNIWPLFSWIWKRPFEWKNRHNILARCQRTGYAGQFVRPQAQRFTNPSPLANTLSLRVEKGNWY